MRKVIFTYLSKGYDKLREVKHRDPLWDYVCFTDDGGLDSKTWEIVKLPPSLDIKRQSREIKTLAHVYFPEATQTIYIDATRETITPDLEALTCSKREGIWLESHPSKRGCIYKEAQVALERGLDDPQTLQRQIDKYKAEGYPEKAGLFRGGVIIRNKGCEEFNEAWWEEIKNFSHRDQISLPYALNKVGLRPNKILSGIVDSYFRLHLHEPRVLTGGITHITDREKIWAVPSDHYIVWGDFDDPKSALLSNPPSHLILNGKGGMIFPRWLWNYLQFIDHLPDYVTQYRGSIIYTK